MCVAERMMSKLAPLFVNKELIEQVSYFIHILYIYFSWEAIHHISTL